MELELSPARQTPAATDTPADPRLQMAPTTHTAHRHTLPAHQPPPHPQAQQRHRQSRVLPGPAFQEAANRPLPDRQDLLPTSGPAWPGQKQGDLPRGAAVRACRRQVAWVPPDPAKAPQAWGKRIQPAWLVSSNVSL